MGGSNLPQAFPNYLICLRFIRISTVCPHYCVFELLTILKWQTIPTFNKTELDMQIFLDFCHVEQLFNPIHRLISTDRQTDGQNRFLNLRVQGNKYSSRWWVCSTYQEYGLTLTYSMCIIIGVS